MSTEPFMQIPRFDALTGLPNRAFFNEVLNKTLSYAKRRNKILAVLIVDLTSFKQVNAHYGSIIGEGVLIEIAKRFSQALRSEDLLAKLDGDEFIILLNDIDKPKFASAVAEKILRACLRSIKIGSLEVSVTASIGISVFPNDGASLDDLLSHADAALFKAKKAGEGIYQFYAQEMNVEAREFIQISAALHEAIEKKEFVVFYQPKLNLKQGKVTSVEALIRWVHPKLGILTPDKFIPVAEETGLIMAIGKLVLAEVALKNKFWQSEGYGHIGVSVNLSPKQFYHPEMVAVIAEVLKTTQLNPAYLEFEVMESTVMDNIELATEVLTDIKALGVKLSIDHFGLGTTSISHLKNFPLSILKIDSSFIKGTPGIPNDTAITTAFIGLAHNLGLEVVAEGVETAEQVEFLAAQNCDIIQGYFLSHPVPAEKIVLHFSKLAEAALI